MKTWVRPHFFLNKGVGGTVAQACNPPLRRQRQESRSALLASQPDWQVPSLRGRPFWKRKMALEKSHWLTSGFHPPPLSLMHAHMEDVCDLGLFFNCLWLMKVIFLSGKSKCISFENHAVTVPMLTAFCRCSKTWYRRTPGMLSWAHPTVRPGNLMIGQPV